MQRDTCSALVLTIQIFTIFCGCCFSNDVLTRAEYWQESGHMIHITIQRLQFNITRKIIKLNAVYTGYSMKLIVYSESVLCQF